MQVINMFNHPESVTDGPFYVNLSNSHYMNPQMMEIVDQLITSLSMDYPQLIHQVYAGELSEGVMKEKVDHLLYQRQLPHYVKPDTIRKIFLEKVFGYGILQFLIDDPLVTDIFVNGHDNILKRVAGGKDIPVQIRFKDEWEVEEYFRSIVTRVKSQVNRRNPIVDTRDSRYQLRINGAIRPVVKTPYFTIRKHQHGELTMKELIQKKTLTEELASEIGRYVDSRLNILISGPTGSGKTTLLRGLTEYIHPLERLVVIEEEEELQIWHRNIVSLETLKGSEQNERQISMDDLVKNAMRMAPRRIILGELRGKEALNLIRAFGTGHDGGLTTIHANNVESALTQLSFLMLYADTPLKPAQLMTMVSDSVDLVIHIVNHRVVEVAEVSGYDPAQSRIKARTIWKWKIDSHSGREKYEKMLPSGSLQEKMAFRKAVHLR
ncbi:MAG: CpaF family protein [Bacillaceae bacterium]|nr:CpaF family protein [Bacillaceae bacterium]